MQIPVLAGIIRADDIDTAGRDYLTSVNEAQGLGVSGACLWRQRHWLIPPWTTRGKRCLCPCYPLTPAKKEGWWRRRGWGVRSESLGLLFLLLIDFPIIPPRRPQRGMEEEKIVLIPGVQSSKIHFNPAQHHCLTKKKIACASLTFTPFVLCGGNIWWMWGEGIGSQKLIFDSGIQMHKSPCRVWKAIVF